MWVRTRFNHTHAAGGGLDDHAPRSCRKKLAVHREMVPHVRTDIAPRPAVLREEIAILRAFLSAEIDAILRDDDGRDTKSEDEGA